MVIRRNKPTFTAEDLGNLVLREFPKLENLLPAQKRNSPHQVMGKLYGVAIQAIKDRNIQEVIRCFRLTQQLVELAKSGDIFVNSAIWATFIHSFRRDDPIALEIFHQISPDVRDTLFSPFTFPHSWLREKTIDLPGSNHWQKWLTVDRPVQSEVRRVRQTSCPGHFAVVTIRLEPRLESRAVLFRNSLGESEEVPLAYLDVVIEGVCRGLTGFCDFDKGVAFLQVDLLKLQHHPVDSRGDDFVKAADEAVRQCVEEVGLVEL
jgi:hypothetical protein